MPRRRAVRSRAACVLLVDAGHRQPRPPAGAGAARVRPARARVARAGVAVRAAALLDERARRPGHDRPHHADAHGRSHGGGGLGRALERCQRPARDTAGAHRQLASACSSASGRRWNASTAWRSKAFPPARSTCCAGTLERMKANLDQQPACRRAGCLSNKEYPCLEQDTGFDVCSLCRAGPRAQARVHRPADLRPRDGRASSSACGSIAATSRRSRTPATTWR